MELMPLMRSGPRSFNIPIFSTERPDFKLGPLPEYVEGFFDLKEIKLGSGNLDNYSPSPTLKVYVKFTNSGLLKLT